MRLKLDTSKNNSRQQTIGIKPIKTIKKLSKTKKINKINKKPNNMNNNITMKKIVQVEPKLYLNPLEFMDVSTKQVAIDINSWVTNFLAKKV